MIRRYWPILFIITAVGVAAGLFIKTSSAPDGVARFRFPGPKGGGLAATPYAGKAGLPLSVSYAGPQTIFEWSTQSWANGKPNPITCRSMENVKDARQSAMFSIQDRLMNGKRHYSVGYSFRRTSLLGSGSGSGSFTESIPDSSSPWIATLAPQGPVDVPAGSGIPLWGIFGHREALALTPDSSLEALAAKADWAILIRVRLDR